MTSSKQTPVHLKHAFSYSHDTTKRWPTSYNTELRLATANQGFAGAIPANTPETTARQIVIEHDGGKPEYGATVAVPIYEVNRDAQRDLIVGAPAKLPVRSYNWNLCRGVLLAPIDYVTLESLIWGDEPKEVGVEIFASRQPLLEAWLNTTDHPPHALDRAFQPYLTVTVPWKLYNARWTLFVYSQPAFESGSPRYMARLTFVAGASMTLLASALVGLGLRAQNRQKLLTDQISEARDALAAAQEERQKLSHDLHDNTIQSLYAIQLGLNHTSQTLESQPASARRELSAVRAELDAVIAEIRRFITAEERPDTAADLSGVLRALVERARAGANARIEVRCAPEASDRLAGNQAVQLANIAREALSNSLRHARPQQVQIALRSETDAVCLEISDDGIGFDPHTQTRGMGLTSMTTRSQEMGGTLDIQSAPDKGTRIVICVPASRLEHVEANSADAEPDES